MPPSSLARSGIRSCAFPPRMAPAILGIWPGSSAPSTELWPGTSNLTAFRLAPFSSSVIDEGALGPTAQVKLPPVILVAITHPLSPELSPAPLLQMPHHRATDPSLQRERAVPTSPTPQHGVGVCPLGSRQEQRPRSQLRNRLILETQTEKEEKTGYQCWFVLKVTWGCTFQGAGCYSLLCSETDFNIVQTPVR